MTDKEKEEKIISWKDILHYCKEQSKKSATLKVDKQIVRFIMSNQ